MALTTFGHFMGPAFSTRLYREPLWSLVTFYHGPFITCLGSPLVEMREPFGGVTERIGIFPSAIWDFLPRLTPPFPPSPHVRGVFGGWLLVFARNPHNVHHPNSTHPLNRSDNSCLHLTVITDSELLCWHLPTLSLASALPHWVLTGSRPTTPVRYQTWNWIILQWVIEGHYL